MYFVGGRVRLHFTCVRWVEYLAVKRPVQPVFINIFFIQYHAYGRRGRLCPDVGYLPPRRQGMALQGAATTIAHCWQSFLFSTLTPSSC